MFWNLPLWEIVKLMYGQARKLQQLIILTTVCQVAQIITELMVMWHIAGVEMALF